MEKCDHLVWWDGANLWRLSEVHGRESPFSPRTLFSFCPDCGACLIGENVEPQEVRSED